MTARYFKKGLFARVLVTIIIVNFVFVSVPAGVDFSSVFAQDNLRPRAASDKATADSLLTELQSGPLSERLIVTFQEVGKDDIPIAGGKGANLGELQSVKDVDVPPGVAVTTKAFQLHIDEGAIDVDSEPMTLRKYINFRLTDIDYNNSQELAQAGEDIRKAIESATMPDEVETEIRKWYQQLCDDAGIPNLPVAIRSSATAEDLPDASFAGQQDTYLNIRGIDAVLDAVRRNWASLFTDRAIFYRHEQNIDHAEAYISVVIQQMVESYVAGTVFTVHTDTGFPSVSIDGAWGLGEGVVSGAANPDSGIVSRSKDGSYGVYRKVFGNKLQKVAYREIEDVNAKEGTELVDTSVEERNSWALTEERMLEVAKAATAIHEHYGRYMDIEWAFDDSGKLWILQARSETPWNKWEEESPDTVKMENTVVPDNIAESAQALLSGINGSRAAAGKVVIVDAEKEGMELAKELDRVEQGNILATTMTKPDMVPAMKRAGAIVTDEGGPTCHAAIVARELGIPCIVGTGKATQTLKEGDEITVDANRGRVYAGLLQIEEIRNNVYIPGLATTKTKIGTMISSPFEAMKKWQFSKYLSHYGVGLLRKEFADSTEILVHPLAGLAYDMYNNSNFKDETQKLWIKQNIIDNPQLKAEIENAIKGYSSFAEFFVDKLANTIALIAAAQKDEQRVKFRTTDFKTNEYRNQIGGHLFEPEENNPMMGYRGINRMLSESYSRAFDLEIEAIRKARVLQKNIDVMFPVVRTPEELKQAVELLAQRGLVSGEDGFQIGMMVEVPSNVFQADEFFQYVDFMSIGSNDMTQFFLALGRDNEKMKSVFSETNPAVLKALEIVIKSAKTAGVISGLCGQRPSNDPEFAAFLVKSGIDSITVVPEVYEPVVKVVAQAEKELEGERFDATIAGWKIPEKDGNPQRIVCAQVSASEIIEEIGIHPSVMVSIEDYANVVDSVYEKIMAEVAETPVDKPIIYSTDDLDKTDYEDLMAVESEPPELFDENPQLGFCGLARVVDPEYQQFFRWQLEAIQKARQDSGRKNIGIRLNLVRTLDEVKTAVDIMKEEGLEPGKDGFMVGMELASPSSVLLVSEFIKLGINFLTENNERFLSYNLAMDPGSDLVNISDAEKEAALDIPRRVWTTAAEEHNIPLVQQADGFIRSADTTVNSAFPGRFENIMDAVEALENSRGALVIGANVIFENSGNIDTLRKVKKAKTDLKVAVWANNQWQVDKLKLMGIEEVSDVGPISLGDALEQLEKAGIEKERTILINTENDLTVLLDRPTEAPEWLEMVSGLKAVNLRAPDTKEGNLNSMPLVIARAIASIFREQESVVKPYQELTEKYSESGQISEEDLAALNDLAGQIKDMRLVKISEEAAQAQISYEEIIDQI